MSFNVGSISRISTERDDFDRACLARIESLTRESTCGLTMREVDGRCTQGRRLSSHVRVKLNEKLDELYPEAADLFDDVVDPSLTAHALALVKASPAIVVALVWNHVGKKFAHDGDIDFVKMVHAELWPELKKGLLR